MPLLGEWDFGFGLEAEYLLVEAETFRPLSYHELRFGVLNAALESIAVDDLGPLDGLPVQPPHRRIMPYGVEGYHWPDPETPGASVLPKGIEIRTPISSSIGMTLERLHALHARLQAALRECGYCAVALSHHPVDDHFEGPQGSRRYDLWRWAMQAMLTYGPDVNVSLPPRLARRLNGADLLAKVNYYAPSLAALTLASPFHQGGLWTHRGRVGRSLRTFRRSVIGPPIELHPEQPERLEFKPFEMTHRLSDFAAYFLLWLELLLDDGLRGRADDPTRIYDLGAVARDGLEAETIAERAAEVLDRAPAVLAAWDFDPSPLAAFRQRLLTRRLPADELIELYHSTGSLPAVLRTLAPLVPGDAPYPFAAALFEGVSA